MITYLGFLLRSRVETLNEWVLLLSPVFRDDGVHYLITTRMDQHHGLDSEWQKARTAEDSGILSDELSVIIESDSCAPDRISEASSICESLAPVRLFGELLLFDCSVNCSTQLLPSATEDAGAGSAIEAVASSCSMPAYEDAVIDSDSADSEGSLMTSMLEARLLSEGG